jgi:hypothetical protein
LVGWLNDDVGRNVSGFDELRKWATERSKTPIRMMCSLFQKSKVPSTFRLRSSILAWLPEVVGSRSKNGKIE